MALSTYTLTRAASKHSTRVHHPRDDTRAPLSTTYTDPLTRSLKRRPYHRLSTSSASLRPPRTIQTSPNEFYHSSASKLDYTQSKLRTSTSNPYNFRYIPRIEKVRRSSSPSASQLSNAPLKLLVHPLVPVASPPSPTVVNAEITKLAINDDAPRTRATTPETVASNRAPGSVPTPLVDPALPPLPPPPTYAEIPPPSSHGGRAIQPVLHPDELQQGMANGRAQPIQPRSNPSPPLALPGRFPRTTSPKKPREHINPHERMESHEPNSTRLPPPAATTSGTSSGAEISHVPAQKPQSKLPPPTKRGKERAMVQPDLRRDGAHRPFPPRHIPTPRTRQDSRSGTQHAEPSRQTLSRVGTDSPQSFYSSSKDAPDAPPLHSPVPKRASNIFFESPPSEPLESLPDEPSVSDLSLNSHWKQYLRAVMSNHRVDLEDHSLAEIKLCLGVVESKVDQLHVVIPENQERTSEQLSRYLNRVERIFEDGEDTVSKLHNKVHNLEVKLQEHHRNNRALLEAQFNTFQDVLSRVEAQSVHASLTLNTLEAKLVSSMEHQLQGIQTRITCNCLNSNAHTACHQAPSQVDSRTPPGQEMSRISPPGEDIKIVPSISPTPAPQQSFSNQNNTAENNASPCLSDITAAPWGSMNKDMHKMILQTMPK
ncbi:hypothetical protein KEM48_007992, partial [Puccinia striiformis f. sp. tritici PST-130]